MHSLYVLWWCYLLDTYKRVVVDHSDFLLISNNKYILLKSKLKNKSIYLKIYKPSYTKYMLSLNLLLLIIIVKACLFSDWTI